MAILRPLQYLKNDTKDKQDFLSGVLKQEGGKDMFKKEIQELKDTGTFSSTLENKYMNYLKNKPTDKNIDQSLIPTAEGDKQVFGESFDGKIGPGLNIKQETKIGEAVSGTPPTISKVNGRDWELGQAEKNIYDTLSKEQQDAFWLTRDKLAKNQTDYTKDLVQYLERSKADTDYLKSQQEKKTQINSLTGEIQNIQSSQRLQQANNQLNNLKQNIAYIGTLGAPGVSAVKMEAVQKQVSQAENTYSQMQQVENNLKQIRELGLEIDTKQFEKQMSDLQNSMDDQVNKSIQGAYNQLLAADANGKLDTIEDIEKFKMEVLANMDTEIAGITDKSFQERKFLIDQANLNIENANIKIAEYKKGFEAFQKNANTVNTQMSQAQGYYVDGNGNPIISATTGTTIQIPQEAPMDPVFDKNTGKLITFTTDENGKIVANVDQVIDEPSFAQETINSVVNSVKNGIMTPQQAITMFPQLAQNEQFIQGLGNIKQVEEQKKEGLIKMGEDSIYDPNTGKWITKPTDTGATGSTWVYSGYADTIQSDIDRIGGDSNLTGELIEGVANKYGVDPALLAGVIRNDTSYGKKMYSQYNYGNVGNNDTLVASGAPGVGFTTPEEGVSAVANNLIKRINAYKSIYGDNSTPTTKEILSGVSKDGKKFFGVYMTDKSAYDRVSQIQKQLDKGTKVLQEQPQDQQVSQEAKSWIDLWNKGTMDLETIMTKIGSSKEALTLKNQVAKAISEQGGVAWRKPTDPIVKSVEDNKILIGDLLKDKTQLENVSGVYQFSPWDSLTDKKQQYLSKIQYLLDGETLQNLIDKKAEGATFGALSNEELAMLQKSSSLLNSAAKRDDTGKITGFTMSEKDFKKELNKMLDGYNTSIKSMTGEEIIDTGTEKEYTEVKDIKKDFLNY